MSDKSYEEMVADAKTRIREVRPADVVEMRQRHEPVVLLDCREPSEWNLFHIAGAIHVPLGELRESIAELVPSDRDVIVYCARGNRSALAADAMQGMGYTNVRSMAEGIRGWVNAGGEVEQ
ncbi:MAG: rhodanese-like domain-containing protein [Gemmatimonadaceae bacterium]